jgi:lysophospholipase L1-like esterase
MYLQGRRIRSTVPRLPEATGPEGVCGSGNGVIRLLCIGESTFAGVGVKTHEEGFAGSLAKALSERMDAAVQWKVYARSGYTARTVREKLVPRIAETEADLIVIGLGGNDAFTLNTPWAWKRDIRGLIEALRQKFGDTPIVFANMPPIREFPAFTPLIRFTIGNLVEILGEALQAITTQLPNVYFSSRTITLSDWITRLGVGARPADFFSDGVHPSRLTYQAWAKDLAAFACGTVAIAERLTKRVSRG